MERIERIYDALCSRPLRTLKAGERMRAAVAIVLEERDGDLNVLLIERAINNNDPWSGHIAFPGGRSDSSDAGLRETAERECREELGLDLTQARYLGCLGEIAPRRLRLVITAFVYGVEERPDLSPNRDEIANAFWFPLHEIHNPARCTEMIIQGKNHRKSFPALQLSDDGGQPLWGITYQLLRTLGRLINKTDANRLTQERTSHNHKEVLQL